MLESNLKGPYAREAAQFVALRDRIEETRMPLDASPRGDALVVCALARLQGRDDHGGGGPYLDFLGVAERELAASCRSQAATGSVADLFSAVRSAYVAGHGQAA